MASRAHVIPNYSYGREVSRRRRPVVFQTNDPVVLPRGRSWDFNGGLIAAAAAATLLIAGATYAVFHTEPSARLAETPTAPIEREYAPPSDFARVNALKALSAPVTAAPAAMMPAPVRAIEEPPTSNREVIIDDSAPGVQESLPQPLENQPSAAPYPDPTTTVPELPAPVEDATPALDNENPYR